MDFLQQQGIRVQVIPGNIVMLYIRFVTLFPNLPISDDNSLSNRFSISDIRDLSCNSLAYCCF